MDFHPAQDAHSIVNALGFIKAFGRHQSVILGLQAPQAAVKRNCIYSSTVQNT